MYAFTTTGTTEFLEKLMLRHPKIVYKLMRGNNTTLVYYEGSKKRSIFASGTGYEILFQHKPIWEFGFVAMEHIPVLEESIPLFEGNFAREYDAIKNIPTLLSARLLKEIKSTNYLFITQWESEAHYEDWKKGEEIKQSFFANKTRLSTYFANRPFTNKYHLIKEEK